MSLKALLVLIVCLVIASFGLLALPVSAQTGDPTPSPPPLETPQPEPDIPKIHVVQEGETLSSIAQLYGTTIELLQQLNDISDPSLLFVGQELTIPGGGGTVAATVHILGLGETLPDLAAAYNTSVETLAADNRLVSPDYLVAGLPLTVLSRTGSTESQPLTGLSYTVQAGDTLWGIAVAHRLSPTEILTENQLDYPTYLFPGQRLRLPLTGNYQTLPAYWQQVRLYPLPMVPGESAAIYVENQLPGLPKGRLGDQELTFTPYQDGYLAFAALDAFAEPGRYLVELGGSGDRPWPPFSQQVEVISGEYGTQYITVDESLAPLLAPEVRMEEDNLLATYFTQVSQDKQWNGLFQVPVTNTTITAPYGDARSYNEGPIEIFHTGVDFAGVVGTPIRAAAAGTVVYTGTLPLHGGTLIVDHGLGIMTAYYHLSNFFIDVGDQVEVGQIIAEGGSSGLSSGPHLHWDFRVVDVPVNGLQWTQTDLIAGVMALTGRDQGDLQPPQPP